MKSGMRILGLIVVAGALSGAVAAEPSGSASVRWESSWATFRTAAADLLGWKVGVPASAFGQLTFSEAAAKTDALGLASIEGYSTQRVSAEISKNLDFNLSPDELAAVRTRLRALRLQMTAYHVDAIGADDASRRKLFEFAKALGVEMIIANPDIALLPELDKLAGEFSINVAIENRSPKSVLSALEGRGKRIGVCADIGVWMQEGIKPLEGLTQLKDRLMAVNLQDRSGYARAVDGDVQDGREAPLPHPWPIGRWRRRDRRTDAVRRWVREGFASGHDRPRVRDFAHHANPRSRKAHA